jgi:hypothetical protein
MQSDVVFRSWFGEREREREREMSFQTNLGLFWGL